MGIDVSHVNAVIRSCHSSGPATRKCASRWHGGLPLGDNVYLI